MNAERWHQIENLFAQTLDCPAPERRRFLDEACQGDDDLRREVESLLECDAPGERLIEIPNVSDAPETLFDTDMSGRRVGPYRILHLIGRGGMGAVYLGVRDDDHYQKQVAIKVLNRGMNTDFMLGRFRQERQILANLEHPFIARLLDGGATEDGLPYFVMEYVDGVPVTSYCAGRKLSTGERLRLFCMVCEAVQHAHQNLVVHRDIKPGNILTTKEGIPKLLDFGIAKMLDPGIEMTLTRVEQRMLTPDYASPEQIQGLPVSTAADTYSLGAVLYEVLTGKRPHRFASASLADLEKAICVEEPVRPSVAAATNENLPLALRRHLRGELSGDLDNILLTALSKEPQRRYASASEFADDLRRHLEGRPVRAHEDRWTYRAAKFVRRNRLAMGTAVLVAASLLGGIVATTIQARRAEQRFQIVRGLARKVLFDLYNQMERLPGSTPLRAETLRTVVNYLDTLAQSRSGDPELDLEIATAYERVAQLEGSPFSSNLGHGAEALTNFQKSLALYERLSTRSAYRRQATRGIIDMHIRIASMNSLLGMPAEAKFHSQKAAEIARAAFSRGGDEVPPDTQINVYFQLADLEYERGALDDEVANYRKALEVALAWVAAGHSPAAESRAASTYRALGSAQARAGDLAGALETYRTGRKAAEDLVRRADAVPEYEFGVINVYTALGDLMGALDDPNFGDRAAAQVHYREALAIAGRLAAADVRNVNGKRQAASCYWRLGMMRSEEDPERAVDDCRKALQLSLDAGSGDPRNAEYRYHASRAYLWMGRAQHRLHRYQDAWQSLNRAVELQKSIEATSPQRVWNLRVLSRGYCFLGEAQRDGGDPDGALISLRLALETADRMLQRAPNSLPHQIDRADALEALGRHYAALAPKAAAPLRRAELLRQARASFEAAAVVWKAWMQHRLASPYAGRRESEVAAALASLAAETTP